MQVQAEHNRRAIPAPKSGAPETLRVWLLGGFRVSVGSRSIGEEEWRLKKAASLIKLLALAEGHCLHRERAMEFLWPDLDPEAALNNLHYALHIARRTLGPSAMASAASRYLRHRGEQLGLCPDGPLWVDVEAFEEAAATARHALQPAAYRAAIELYSGELLPEDRYELWVEERREKLEEVYLSLLLELAGLYEERKEFGEAIEALVRVVAEEPTHEEAHLGLMRLYALSERPREALRQYERLREALFRELGEEPEAAAARLWEEIRAGTFPPTGSPVPVGPPPEEPPEGAGGRHNLPLARTSFVGREREVLEVKWLLAMTRLLTLTGVGGCGKTRLALKVAGDLVGAYPDGVWLVELASFSEPELVPQAVAQALGVREQPNRPLIETLKDVLRTRKMLLVLDNCEHLLEAVVGLVDALLDSCPGLRVLATSRETLNAAGEVSRVVPSLSVPDSRQEEAYTAQELEGYESVRLFVDRAHQRDPSFALTSRNAQAVAQVCRRLEGIPLAIELAAARMGVLSAEQLASRLEDPLKLLTRGGWTVEPRQRTLRATLEWSYELLSEPERKLFRRLSAFAGGWTLEAAEEVCSGEGIEQEDVLDLLSELVEKSLVVAEAEEGVPRFRMLEPIRQYGRERLGESEVADAVLHRHAAWFLALAEAAEPELKGEQQELWLERLEREHGNLRAALSWALEREEAELSLRLAGALGGFWHMLNGYREGRRWLEAALANGEASPASVRVKALRWAGSLAWEQGDCEHSMAFSEEGLALSRELGDTAGIATALYNLGAAALFQNELERASALAGEAMTLQRELGDEVGLARSLLVLGLVAISQHDYERAMALQEESLALGHKVEDNFAIILSLQQLAIASLLEGDYRRARALSKRGLELSRQQKMRHLTIAHLHVSAALAVSQGQPHRSARLWGATESLREALGVTLPPYKRRGWAPYIDAARAQLNEAAWEKAWEEGQTMTFEEAVAYAISEEEPATPPVSPPPKQETPADRQPPNLTPREREIALLVGRKLTNRQIALELSISEHTVANHVAKILKKLELHSRAQIGSQL